MSRCKVEPLCTTEELTAIIVAPTGGLHMEPSDPYNQVYPNLFVGDADTARGIQALKSIGITHVLNAAFGKGKFYFVNTNADFYSQHGIKFFGVPAIDLKNFQLEPYFQESADFIEEGIQSGGKVLVHCMQGISRSATLALAYLMIKKGMTAQEAVRTVRTHREIIPNQGFLQQLCNLNEKIHREAQGTGLKVKQQTKL